MKNYPLVSLITPGWNGITFVHRLLDSILAQTYLNIEYIYVDDGSTDGTKDVVLSYKSRFEARGISFKYIYKKNGGVSSAVQEGLKYVNGKYLGWPEYDDILTPDSIEKRVEFLEEHDDCAVVTCDAWLLDEHNTNKILGVLSRKNPNRFDRNHFVQALLSNTIFTAACHLVRMDVFDKTHPDRKIFSSWIGPNWQMLLPLYYNHNRGFIDEPLVYYLVRENSISHSHDTIEKQINAIEEYQRILYDVIDKIEMPTNDRRVYKKMIENKYAKDWCALGYKYNNKEIFDRGYTYFITNNVEVSQEIAIQKKSFENFLYRYYIRFLKGIVWRLTNLMH